MFAFSQIDPETTGSVSEMPVQAMDYLAEGVKSAFGGTLKRIYDYRVGLEEEADTDSPMLTAEEANRDFPIAAGWKEPVRESFANYLNTREQKQQAAAFYLSSKQNVGIQGLGFASSMISGMLNPVDMALMFVPVVGRAPMVGPYELEAIAAGSLGRGARFREALSKGLVTNQRLEQIFGKFAGVADAAVQGAAFGVMVEPINRFIASSLKEDPGNPLLNIGEMTLGAAGMHALFRGLGRAWARLSDDSKLQMMTKGIDDFVKGKDIEVQTIAKSDIKWAEEKVLLQEELDILLGQIEDPAPIAKSKLDLTFEQKIQNIFRERIEAFRKEMLKPGEKPSVPATGGSVEQVAYSSVLDEIRKKNLRTKEQIQKNFPDAQLSREEAAVLRRSAWHEIDVRAQHNQNIKEILDTATEQRKGAKATARRKMEQDMPTPPSLKVEEMQHDVLKPEDATIAKVEEKAKEVEKKVVDKIKKKIEKVSKQPPIKTYNQERWDLLVEEIVSAADIYAQGGSGRESLGAARNYDLVDEIQNFMDFAFKEHQDLSIKDALKLWKAQSDSPVGQLRKLTSLINDIKVESPVDVSMQSIGLERQRGPLGKKGYFTTQDKNFTGLSVQITDKGIHLNNIQVPDNLRGKGIGTKKIEQLKQVADELGLPLTLTAEALSKDVPANQARLEAYYERLGFKRIKENEFKYEGKKQESLVEKLKAEGEARIKALKEKADAVKPIPDVIQSATECLGDII